VNESILSGTSEQKTMSWEHTKRKRYKQKQKMAIRMQEKEELREHIIGEKGATDLGIREREEF
jgi:hypothetical protein